MVNVTFEEEFKKSFTKIKDKATKDKIIKQISKIKDNPEIGKPMRYERLGTRELYLSPFRISYRIENNHIYMLNIYHKDNQ